MTRIPRGAFPLARACRKDDPVAVTYEPPQKGIGE